MKQSSPSKHRKTLVNHCLSLTLLCLWFAANADPAQPLSNSLDDGGNLYKAEAGNLTFAQNCSVYVPAYSQIYLSRELMAPLAVTLSIRNTDSNNKLHIRKVDYFDSQGKLIENLVTSLSILSPMATASFVIAQRDLRGGAGANFVVEWAGDKTLSPPIIEAIMAGYAGTKGLSFQSRGETIKCSP